jgi:hypothetical protein
MMKRLVTVTAALMLLCVCERGNAAKEAAVGKRQDGSLQEQRIDRASKRMYLNAITIQSIGFGGAF